MAIYVEAKTLRGHMDQLFTIQVAGDDLPNC